MNENIFHVHGLEEFLSLKKVHSTYMRVTQRNSNSRINRKGEEERDRRRDKQGKTQREMERKREEWRKRKNGERIY